MSAWYAVPLIDPRTIVGHPDCDPKVARASFDAFIKRALETAGPQPTAIAMTQETADALEKAIRRTLTPSPAKEPPQTPPAP